MTKRFRGFTLVELLVVIGIIALLISILLPSLNRARQAANVIDCQARLRTMGQALSIYESNNRGLLPWAEITDSRPGAKIQYWWWTYTLAEVMDRGTIARDGSLAHLSGVFRDKDTIDAADQPAVGINHYTCNQRLFYRPDIPDDGPFFTGGSELPGGTYPQRKVTSVKRTSDVFVLWDAPQWQDNQGNAYAIAEAIDAWGWYNTGLITNSTSQLRLDLAIPPGQLGASGVSDGKAAQRKFNQDSQFSFGGSGWQSHLRFRHMNNTTLAALVLDGHVVTRKVGTVLRSDIYTNYK
jgi:prepilin-type N-terminal cleavage/methylation domain-containing protein